MEYVSSGDIDVGHPQSKHVRKSMHQSQQIRIWPLDFVNPNQEPAAGFFFFEAAKTSSRTMLGVYTFSSGQRVMFQLRPVASGQNAGGFPVSPAALVASCHFFAFRNMSPPSFRSPFIDPVTPILIKRVCQMPPVGHFDVSVFADIDLACVSWPAHTRRT